MKLLEQIILHAVDEMADVPRLLRLCLVLANQLRHEPFKQWVTAELEGYRTGEVPSYRIFGARLRGVFRNSQWETTLDIPMSSIPQEGQHFSEVHYRPSVSETVRLIGAAKDNGIVQIPLDTELAAAMSSLVPNGYCVSLRQEFSSVYLSGLIDNLKTKVLRFALEIEQQYPDLGNSTKLPPIINGEKVANIFNTTINGSVSNFATGSQNFSQNSGVEAKEISTILASLRAAGVPNKDVEELQQSLDKEPPTTKDGLVTQCRDWLVNLAMRAIEPTASELVKTAATTAKEVLKPLLGG